MKSLIEVAAGRKAADIIFKNANVVNVFSSKIERKDVAVYKDKIAGVGEYDNAKSIIDCTGKFLLPGLIDSHVHIESTHLTPYEFARTVVPCGTTTVIADPHEIANVCGVEGIEFIYEQSKSLPLDIKIMFPSCVPATSFETSGAVLTHKEMAESLSSDMIFGVGEFMNFPGVIYTDDEVIKKLETAKTFNKIIDGHASNVTKNQLNAYLCGGISTDHECTNVAEMLEKIDRGMYVQIREGSATRNLSELIKAVTPQNMRRCLMCTDDKTPQDLLTKGHLDNNIRQAISLGISAIDAIIMATLNAAECYGLKYKGAIAPSYFADIVICDNLTDFNILQVYKNGVLVAKEKKALFSQSFDIPQGVLNTVRFKDLTLDKFKLKLKGNKAKVIKLVENNVVTENVVREVPVKDGCFYAKGSNFLKIAVVERHKLTGNVGLAIIENYGLTGGAIALTVAHDSHNIIILSDNDEDMLIAANELKRVGGGITIVKGGKVLKTLPLEIAGLLTHLDAVSFNNIFSEMVDIAYSLGVKKNIEPFMSLSFISLSVIPHLKVTDFGLFNVDKFAFTEIDA